MSYSQNFITSEKNKIEKDQVLKNKSSHNLNKYSIKKRLLRSTKIFKFNNSNHQNNAKTNVTKKKRISSFLKANRNEMLRKSIHNKR